MPRLRRNAAPPLKRKQRASKPPKLNGAPTGPNPESTATQTETARAAEAARREASRADAARKAAQAEAPPTAAPKRSGPREAARQAPKQKPPPLGLKRQRLKPPGVNHRRRFPKSELVSRTETATAAPRPAPARSTAASSGGTVVGRYALQENAYALRDYYRSQNIRAGVEQIMANDRTMYQKCGYGVEHSS